MDRTPPPEKVLTYEGIQKMKLKTEAQHMHMLMGVHIRTQNPKEPRIQISRTLKHAKMSPVTQTVMIKSVSAMKASTKMLLRCNFGHR